MIQQILFFLNFFLVYLNLNLYFTNEYKKRYNHRTILCKIQIVIVIVTNFSLILLSFRPFIYIKNINI